MRLASIVLVSAAVLASASTLAAEPARAPAVPLPSPLASDDAMLEPIAPPARVIATWDEALGMLRARSTDLKIALDEIERRDGQWRSTLAASLPTVNGTANATRNVLRGEQTFCNPLTGACSTATVPEASTYGASVTLTQPVFAPRAWYALGTADRAREVARLSADDQKRLLAVALANAVVSVVTAERLGEVNRIGLRAALDRATLAKRRVMLGAGNALDTVRAEQDVAVARSAVVTGDESLRKAREALGLALGSTEPFGVQPDINLDGLEASARASCAAAATIDERADIAAARRSTEIAKRNVKDVWLQFSPTVNLTSTMSASSLPFANGKQEAWTIAAVLTVPFFDGGVRYGALRDTRAQEDQAAQRLESARRNATVQVTQARRAVEVAEQTRRVAEQSRDLALETERLARVAFQAGTGTSLDLIESGRRLRESESQLALQEFGLVQARIGALLALSSCRW